MDDQDSNEKLERYIEIGAVDIAGIDEDGEFIFAINESAKDSAPELWEAHMHYVDKALLELYMDGHMQVEYDENLEAMISLSPEGFEIAKAKGILPIDMPEIPNN
jgi:hypothetical protein